MRVETAVETGLKTALEAYTDTLDPDDCPVYRCFWLDDEDESGRDTEPKEYPLISIVASPSVPDGHKSTFHSIPVMLKVATHRSADPKRETLAELYEGVRDIIDAETGITITGYSLTGVMIESGGEAGVEDNEQFATLRLMVKLCGA